MPRARTIASALLLFTGAAHLLYAFAGSGATAGPATALFGGIYLALGLVLRLPAAWPLWLSVLLPALGGLGGIGALLESFEPVMALFVAIDVVVVGCGVRLIVARRGA